MTERTRDSREHTAEFDPWNERESARREILTKGEAVDYAKIVGKHHILFLGENHSNHAIREHIARNAAALREAGITHYLIEANEDGNDRLEALSHSGDADLTGVATGPAKETAGDRWCYEKAIRAMAREGIRVVAIDVPAKTPLEDREQHLLKRIKAFVEEDPRNVVAVLIGASHVDTSKLVLGTVPVRQRLAEAGITASTVRFVGGNDSFPQFFSDAVAHLNWNEKEFMLDMRSYADTESFFGIGRLDFLVHVAHRAPGESCRETEK